MDYIYIRAWSKLLGTTQFYTDREVERARQTNAPETAIYLQSDRSWATVDGIENERMKARVERLAEQLKQGKEVNGI